MGTARSLGVVGAGLAAAFLAYVAVVAPFTASVAVPLAGFYILAGVAIARARRWWATGAAVAVAIVSALLTFLTAASPDSVAFDVLALGTCAVLALVAAGELIFGGHQPPAPTGE